MPGMLDKKVGIHPGRDAILLQGTYWQFNKLNLACFLEREEKLENSMEIHVEMRRTDKTLVQFCTLNVKT